MKQEVNLYHDCLKKSHEKPVIFQYFYAFGLVISLMLIYSVSLILDIKELQGKSTNTRLQLQSAKTHVQLLQVQYPKKQINKLLKQKITQSQEMRSSLAKVVFSLTDQHSDESQGFSRYFSALAEQTVNGLWLTQISVDAQTKNILLYGSTNSPKALPDLLHQLQQESIFDGKVFSKLEMKQAKEESKRINFMISTTTEILEEKNNE